MSKRHLIWWNYVVDVYGILGDLSKKNYSIFGCSSIVWFNTRKKCGCLEYWVFKRWENLGCVLKSFWEIAFIGVLCTCAYARILIEGRDDFSQMIDTKPTFTRHWCMANLYANVGHSRENFKENARHQIPNFYFLENESFSTKTKH